MNGGHLPVYGDYSTGGITEAMRLMFGANFDSNSSDDLMNSRLLVLWGHNPLETLMSGSSEAFYLQKIKRETNLPVVIVDPRSTDSVQLLADMHIAPKPGTDAALVAGLAHVLITENLFDQAFLDKYCVGFDEDHMPDGAPANASYRSYIEGKGADGVEKTPEWASQVTGVPVDQIIRFARLLGTTKPVAIQQGLGPQRHANGENQSGAVMTLNAMLGMVGLPGGGTGTYTGASRLDMAKPFDSYTNSNTKAISHFSWVNAIDHGTEMGPSEGMRDWDSDGNLIDDARLDVPIKAMWAYA